MEPKDLLTILADYLNFAVDFLLLRGMDKYVRLDVINKDLTSFFVAGVLFAYIISLIKIIPGYEGKKSTVEVSPGVARKHSSGSDNPSQNGNQTFDLAKRMPDVAQFVLISIFGAALFHCYLILYHKLFGSHEIGTIKDTLNAFLAVGAIYNPLLAVSNQVQRVTNLPAANSHARLRLAAWILAIVIILPFPYYYLYALAKVHRTTQMYMLGPVSVFAIVNTTIVMVLFAIRGSPSPPSAAAQQSPPPNVSPAAPVANSGATEGPPSVT